MDLLTVLLIAVGLAMDALAVSIARGMYAGGDKLKTALYLGTLFGGFQMLMPLIGWAVGLSFRDLISSVDHWIAFGLLALIGSKMIYDAVKGDGDEEKDKLTPLAALTLATATSIDALMVGLSFAFLEAPIVEPILVIGAVTFTLCATGYIFGCRLGGVFGERVKIVGGIILILIGLKILADHLL